MHLSTRTHKPLGSGGLIEGNPVQAEKRILARASSYRLLQRRLTAYRVVVISQLTAGQKLGLLTLGVFDGCNRTAPR